ncbi:MAG TPA: hypothetical protein DEH78_19325 [Solibacterales bacterium]|nr:hypothetical protein [Bryobacterales bacterium]
MRIYLLIAAVLLVSRWFHRDVVWVDEAYPTAAAVQILDGKTLYRDIWFDKPPLYAWVYLLWGAKTGLPPRVAGAAFALLCAWLAGRLAHHWWDAKAEVWAASLMAFFLVFYLPVAVIPLAPDLLTIPLALATVLLQAKKRPVASGLAAGAALWVNAKALYLLPLCLLQPVSLIGFAAAQAAGIFVLAAQGALGEYWLQVWTWGAAYARNTPLASPFTEGLRRTANWLGFHAAAAAPAAWWFLRRREPTSRTLLLWAALALVSVALGLRFFPRYYFALLPPLVLAASRAMTLLPNRFCLALLLIPALRFAPGYAKLHSSPDLALFRDAQAAARVLHERARPGETLLVWGYRPELQALTRMPAGSRFLDSQPLNGVFADRHLFTTTPSAESLARPNRAALLATRPDWIADGLASYNPRLAIAQHPALPAWLSGYQVVARTEGFLLYRRR